MKYVVNLTTGGVISVCWENYPVLFGEIVRVVFYSQKMERWMALVPRRSPDNKECLEVEPGDLARVVELQKAGFSELDSFKRVLGL
jgi:hypothetical protein